MSNIQNNRKNTLMYSLILGVNFFFQFLVLWSTTSETTALMVIDPYLWANNVLYLNNNGIINNINAGYEYPWGFIFICGGSLAMSPDMKTTYFFFKFACFPFLNFYTLVLFSISKRLFKRNSLIFFCLISILPNTYFLYRMMMFLSSSISVLLILISFLILLTGLPKHLFGLILPAIFLINPIYALYFSMALLIFYIIRFIISYRNFISIFIEAIVILFFSGFFLIPYIINVLYFFDYTLVEFIRSFSWMFKSAFILEHIKLVPLSEIYRLKSPVVIYLYNSFWQNLSYNIYGAMHLIYLYGILFGLSISCLFLPFKRKSWNYRDFIIFMKIGLILLLTFAFIAQMYERNFFFLVFNFRIIEAFFPCVIFLAGFCLEKLWPYFEKLMHNFKFEYNPLSDSILD